VIQCDVAGSSGQADWSAETLMPFTDEDPGLAQRAAREFNSTHWSVVHQAMARLGEECRANLKGDLFEKLESE